MEDQMIRSIEASIRQRKESLALVMLSKFESKQGILSLIHQVNQRVLSLDAGADEETDPTEFILAEAAFIGLNVLLLDMVKAQEKNHGEEAQRSRRVQDPPV